MKRVLLWWNKYIQVVCAILAILLIFTSLIAQTAITNFYLESEEHAKLHYDAELMRFLLLERACTCRGMNENQTHTNP